MAENLIPLKVREFGPLTADDAGRVPLYTSSHDNLESLLEKDTLEDGDYPTIVYKSVGFTLTGVAEAVFLLLSSSPRFLHDPNNARYLNIKFPEKDAVISPKTREGLNAFMSPLTVIEAACEISQNFGRYKMISQRILWPLTFQTVPFSTNLFSFEAEFQTGIPEHKTYQYHYSNSIWLVYEGELSVVGALTDGQLLESKAMFVFIPTFFMDKDVFTRGNHPPIWTSHSGQSCPVNAVMKRVRCMMYYAKTETNTVKIQSWIKNRFSVLNLMFVGKISQFARGQRMLSIPSLPIGFDPMTDPNLSPLFDCIISPSKFTKLSSSCEQTKDKFLEFMKLELPILIIGGGPGTGKTNETAQMVIDYFKERDSERKKILICAASNSAVDVIFLLLHKMSESNGSNLLIWRTGKDLRFGEQVSTIVTKIYNTYKNKLTQPNQYPNQALIKKKILLDADIVCCTYGATQQRDFTESRDVLKIETVIFDECPLAKLTEFFLPFFLKSLRRILIIGDPQQLGPTFSSPLAARFPQTETVMFNRLSTHVFTENPQAVITLENQFRMRALVASLLNKIMENKDKKALKTPSDKDAMWQSTVANPALLVFSGQSWEESKTGGSHSYFNENEAQFGAHLLQALKLRNAGRNVSYAIICMYKDQVLKYKKILKLMKIDKGVRIGTIDEMQGTEFHYTIVSGVRSSKIQAGLAFISDVRRLNVAMSRGSCVYILAKYSVFKTQKGWHLLYYEASKINCVYSNADQLLEIDHNGKVIVNRIGQLLEHRGKDDAQMEITEAKPAKSHKLVEIIPPPREK